MILEISFGPLMPALPEFIAGIVLFIVVWFGIAKLVVPRFEQTYAERTAQIAGGIEKAEQAQKEAAEALRRYNEQLATARDEASALREEAKAQGAAILAEMRNEAQDESRRLIAQATSQIEAERVQAVQQLRSEVGGLATTLAGKIVGESLDDDERARRTVDRFIADLEASNTEKV
ncbi:F0F1 ATP synthase subunit B [Micropruina sp.]|uniref:F0F1 ATP synthase subunit B n=1 Tax=Micropruina sp. TaxID=2737536 RepID=UPI0039E4CC29